MRNTIKAIMVVAAALLTFAGTAVAKKGGTDWLPAAEFNSFVAEKKEKGFFGRTGYWITRVDGRYRDGQIEFRLRYESTPSDGGFTWNWCYGVDKDHFDKWKREAKKKAIPLVHEQSFELPSGKRLYQAVWQYQE